MKEEYEKLLFLLTQTQEKFNLELILKESVLFFDKLKEVYPAASPEEKAAISKMVNDLHHKIQLIAKKAAEGSGMSEEELSAYGENPSNFSPEQWRMIQDTKGKLNDSARRFSQALSSDSPPSNRPRRVGKPSPTKTGHTKRRNWLKS